MLSGTFVSGVCLGWEMDWPAYRKYSEIVWLLMGRTASTSTNVDGITGLPNTYSVPVSPRVKGGAKFVSMYLLGGVVHR